MMSMQRRSAAAGGQEPSASRVIIRGFAPTGAGAPRFAEPLRHGWSPQRMLRASGWRPVALRGYSTELDGRVNLDYAVLPTATQAVPKPVRAPLDGSDLAVTRFQRLGAYAVVRSRHGVLLTELSQQTSRAGLWVLPGGGVEPGELPQDAAVREVWEESGQAIDLGALIDVSTSHRIGEFRGGMEDFHAVRMIFAATCAEPGPLVVHDVGGSTGRAQWFARELITDAARAPIPGGVAPWVTEAVRKATAP